MQAVLEVVARQGELDAAVEKVKSKLPPDADLASIFAVLDQHHKGYVADTDIWLNLQQVCRSVPFSAVSALIRRVQASRPGDLDTASSRLSLREFGELVLPKLTPVHRAMRKVRRDAEVLELLDLATGSRPNGPNPKVRAEASVESPLKGPRPLPSLAAARHPLFELLEIACDTADEDERLRHALVCTTTWDGEEGSLLADAFMEISGGSAGLCRADLHRALHKLKFNCGIQELDLLWDRYCGGGETVSVEDFKRQLLPVNMKK